MGAVLHRYTTAIAYILFVNQYFEQLALAQKNRVCPKIFHCIETFFIFQDFLGNLCLS